MLVQALAQGLGSCSAVQMLGEHVPVGELMSFPPERLEVRDGRGGWRPAIEPRAVMSLRTSEEIQGALRAYGLHPTPCHAATKAGVDAGAAWAEAEAEADHGEASRRAVVEAEAEVRAGEARARAAWCTAAARWQWMRKGALLRFTVARRAAAEHVAAERAAAVVRWQRMWRRAGFLPGFCKLLRRAIARRAAAAATFWQRLWRRALRRLELVEHPLLLLVPRRVLAARALRRAAADLAPVIAALERRFECEARSALARLADVFGGDALHRPGLDGSASELQDAQGGCAASWTVPRAWGYAAERRPVPGRGRRRPHVRWRARRESIYIRCPPSTLLQQSGRGL